MTSIEENIDTTYLYYSNVKRTTPSNFYLSNHEVTNSEYWEFIKWVQDSVTRKYLFEGSTWDKKALWGYYVDYKTYNVDTLGRYFILNWDTPLNYYSYSNYPILKPIINSNYGNFSQFNENFIDEDRLAYCYEFPDTELESGAYSLVDVFPNTTWPESFQYGFYDNSENYFKSKIYQSYPVVGISYLQAKAYCHWRSKQFKNNYEALSSEQKKYFSINSYFRLPTETEWERGARGDLDLSQYPWGGPYIRNAAGCFLANFKPLRGRYFEDGGFHTVKVYSYNPNAFGLYCMAGNVAEWCSTTFDESMYEFGHDMSGEYDYQAQDGDPAVKKRKVIRGGSWKDIGYYLMNSTRTYEYQDTAKSYIGFRNVMTHLGRGGKDIDQENGEEIQSDIQLK